MIKKNIKIISLLILSLLSYNKSFSAEENNIKENQKYISNYTYNVYGEKTIKEDNKETKKEPLPYESLVEDKKQNPLSFLKSITRVYAELGFQVDYNSKLKVRAEDGFTDLEYNKYSWKNADYGMNIGLGTNFYFNSDGKKELFFIGTRIGYYIFFNKNFLKDSIYNERINNIYRVEVLSGFRYKNFEPYVSFGYGLVKFHQNSAMKSISKKSDNFLIIGAGFNWYITTHLSVAMEYSYMFCNWDKTSTDDNKVSSNGSLKSARGMWSHILGVKIRYNFS